MTAQYEHERRFLVGEPQILEGHEGHEITQAYIWSRGGYAVRVRRTQARNSEGHLEDTLYLLTMKGPRDVNGSRIEEEFEIRNEQLARDIINSTDTVVSKQRFAIVSEGNTFEVDVFSGLNQGLIIAEFEASERDVALLRKPWWAGTEVTADPRYNNENLAAHPWSSWPENRGEGSA